MPIMDGTTITAIATIILIFNVSLSRRYKMISQFTWPNFHGGDPEEGTRVLLEDRKLVKDVTFGKTKLFVRSPSTLFELEKAR